MNKYEKQFRQLVAGTLDAKNYDDQCEIEKCAGCSSETCSFKQKLKEEYLLNMFVENISNSAEEQTILKNAIKCKDPEALNLFRMFLEQR